METGWILGQAEASRELARLYQATGRNQEAITLLNTAHGLFNRLDARVGMVNVSRKMIEMESAYLAVVRDWGQSIESADHYTFGHCERVAGYAVAVARALRLDAMQQTTLRLGAYLHDVGKVRVPHEILNKPGRLTQDEFEIMKLHPVYGVELLDVFDALTTTRSYRKSMSREDALAEMARCRGWWRAEIYDAFMGSVGAPTWEESVAVTSE